MGERAEDPAVCWSSNSASGRVGIFVFEAVLQNPATTAGDGERDHCGKSSLPLPECPCESICGKRPTGYCLEGGRVC